jgi:4-amino-4-deoxy-L-arabinose transferase-like glycosyltransferase
MRKSAARPAPAARNAEAVRRLPLVAIVLACVAIAAVLRLALPGHYPPGLNQDEAINAWNSWCLLHTGHDMTGASWPLFYSHAIGDQRSTLFFYLLLPVQACFGLSAWSTRLPAALLGIASVPLAAIVARRLAGEWAAVAAALLLALDPWHVFLSRIGVEGGVTPFLALLPLALLARAQLLAPREGETPRIGWALAAGLAAGLGCYGYWSVRLWMPATLLLLALAAGPRVRARMREPAFARAVLALAAGFTFTFGPLAWRHLTDPAIGHRAEMTRLWAPGTPLPRIVALIAQRWAIHFGPSFLFTRGDTYELLQPPLGGALPWFMAPLLVFGLAFALLERRSPACRALLALVIAWPLGDVLAAYDGVHSLRSAVGAPALVLLAAFGAARAIGWAERSSSAARGAVVAALLVIVLGTAARTYTVAFGEYDRRPAIWHGFQADLLQASEWLRGHARAGEPVVCSVTGFNEPWSLMLVGMKKDPLDWFKGPKEMRTINGWDVYTRIGDWWFLYDPADVQRRVLTPQPGVASRPTWLVVRPGEVHETPLQKIADPQGRESLWICRVRP